MGSDIMYWSLQGNIGLGRAIDYFTANAIPVSIPLNDTQKYDLVIDIDGVLKKVQVKTSNCLTENNTYQVQLRNCGGSSGKNLVRNFNNTDCDFIFILTGNGNMYLIPSEKIDAKTAIKVGKKYQEYQVFLPTLEEIIN